MPNTQTATTSTVNVDRKALLTALQRVGWVVPRATVKPILKGVHLEASNGALRLGGTDLDVSITASVEADGGLPPCLVECDELAKRLKASRADVCTMQLDAKSDALVINGGRVEHRIHTMDVKEYPPVRSDPEGAEWRAHPQDFRNGLAVAVRGAALEASRYAINGVMLETDDNGARLVATDGRRMVVIEVDRQEGKFRGQAILPRGVATLVSSLIDRKSDIPIAVFIKPNPDVKGEHQPSDLCVAGPDWRLFCKEAEGCFPQYRDVMPASHSKFVVNRAELVDTLTEVALSTDVCCNSIRFDLTAEALRLSTTLTEAGSSSGAVPVEFAGGGDDHIVTAFNPAFVLDALKSLPDERVVIDIDQNHRNSFDDKVSGRPALVYGVDSSVVIRWLLMPVSLGLPATRETLGSNFDDGKKKPVSATESSKPTETSTSQEAKPARRKVEHVWPEIGTRLDGEFNGQVYAALVIAAPKLKSGRALQLINGPALGQTFKSMTAAMQAATAEQRRKLGSGKKGLPKSGCDFWKCPEAKRMSA